MFQDLKQKLDTLVSKVTKKKSTLADEGDDILKELGLDDDSLLDTGDSSRAKSESFSLEDETVKAKKEKSLLTLSYIALGVSILLSISGTTIVLLSLSTQEDNLAQLGEQKKTLTTQVTELQAKIDKITNPTEANAALTKIDPKVFYEKLYATRFEGSFIIEELDKITEQIQDENIYLKFKDIDIDPTLSQIKIMGETNSYANLGKILKYFNDSDYFTDAKIKGATKTLTADGIASIPFDFNLKFLDKKAATEATGTTGATGTTASSL